MTQAASEAPLPAPISIDTARTGSNHWARDLIRRITGSGEYAVVPCEDNVIIACEGSSSLRHLFAYNTRTEAIELTRVPPWDRVRPGVKYPRECKDSDIAMLRSAVSAPVNAKEPHSMGIGPSGNVSTNVAYQAVAHLASTRYSYDPVVRYLDHVKPKWDGVPRLESVLIRYLGARESKLTRMITRRWFMSAVKRAIEPGCQADLMLVLGGLQGIGKTTFLRTMFGKYHSEDFPDLNATFAATGLQGAWCVEASELAALNRVDSMEQIKRFLTSVADKIRLPYGRMTVSLPRKVVFAATTNTEYWNRDKQARRFMPVWCYRRTLFERDALKRELDQLWGEAYTLLDRGEPHWITDKEFDANDGALRKELHERHEDARLEDPLVERVRTHLLKWNSGGQLPNEIHITQLMVAMEVRDTDMKKHAVSFSNALRVLGYDSARMKAGRVWRLIVEKETAADLERPTAASLVDDL